MGSKCAKKVVLYNTTIDAFLRYGEKAIRKMKSVFRFFEQRNELVLIWRPHPLLETTLRSMRPKLLDEYLEAVDYYKNRNIGILDDSSDLHRAITLSDAYYGDWSSVVDLYKVTGKPILIQNIDVLEEAVSPLKWAFYGYTFHIYQGRMYTTSGKGDALLCKGKNEKMSIITHLMGDSAQELLYSMSVIEEGKIFFAPWNADSFVCYDIASGHMTEIPMERPSGHEIFYLVQYGGNVQAIGLNTMKVYHYDKIKNLFRCISPECGKRKLFALKRARIYQEILFVDKNTNELCIYNTNKNKWSVYPFCDGIIQDLLYDGEWCWLLTEAGSIVKMDISTGKRVSERKVLTNPQTMFLFDRGKDLLLLPEKEGVCIHVEKGTLQSKEETLSVLKDGLKHFFSEISDTKLLAESYKGNRRWYLFTDESLWIYDYLENTVIWRYAGDEDKACREERERLYAAERWASLRKRDCVLVENPNQSLSFLRRLLYAAIEEPFGEVQSCGKKIHEIMMENI